MSSSLNEESVVAADADGVLSRGPIILFDGVCNFCDAWVQFVIRRDRRRAFRFAALQSPVSRRLLEQYGLPTDELNTMVLVDGASASTRSTAALRILRRLNWPWPLLSVLLVIPAFVRDPFYRFVAARRYRWFGKKECLLVPAAEQRDRFLES